MNLVNAFASAPALFLRNLICVLLTPEPLVELIWLKVAFRVSLLIQLDCLGNYIQ